MSWKIRPLELQKHDSFYQISSLNKISRKIIGVQRKDIVLKENQVINPRNQDHNLNTNSFKFKSSNSSKSQHYFQEIQNGIHRFIIINIKINRIEKNNFSRKKYFPLFSYFNSYDFISLIPNKNMYNV